MLPYGVENLAKLMEVKKKDLPGIYLVHKHSNTVVTYPFNDYSTAEALVIWTKQMALTLEINELERGLALLRDEEDQ